MDETAPKPLTPTQMLEEQVKKLNELVAIQQGQTQLLQNQGEKLSDLTRAMDEVQKASAAAAKRTHVKIEDLNMPFWALVGFMVKLTLASIPAAVIVAVLALIASVAFGGLVTGLVQLLGK